MKPIDTEYRQFLKFFYLFKNPAQIKKYFFHEDHKRTSVGIKQEVYFSRVKIIHDSIYKNDKFMARLSDGYLMYGNEINYPNLFSFFRKELESIPLL